MKFNWISLLLLFLGLSGYAQIKSEREFRIKKSQFPVISFEKAQPYLEGVRRLRFYKEIDAGRVSYEIKFKKARLHYSVEFSDAGDLEDIEVRIKPVDIPEESWKLMEDHLSGAFQKYKVRKIQQQYRRSTFPSDSVTFRNAFQNLLLPEIRYELIVHAKTADGYRDFEITYDARGSFIGMKKSLPPNYDHVLY
ncbi:MAG: hypothetical protein P8Z38_02725 [Robiginitalea sp.]